MSQPDAVVYCDGLCEPRNPGGIAAFGWIAYWKGSRAREGYGVVCEGPEATNNVAEYAAVIDALQYLIEKDFRGPLLVRSDSQLVIRQMNGQYAVRSPRIRPHYKQAIDLASEFEDIIFEWIPREKNEPADGLSRRAYYEYRQRKRS